MNVDDYNYIIYTDSGETRKFLKKIYPSRGLWRMPHDAGPLGIDTYTSYCGYGFRC